MHNPFSASDRHSDELLQAVRIRARSSRAAGGKYCSALYESLLEAGVNPDAVPLELAKRLIAGAAAPETAVGIKA